MLLKPIKAVLKYNVQTKYAQNLLVSSSLCSRDLARNEEFSEIAVIHIFFTVLKNKTQLSVGGRGGVCGENFEISHAIDM